jgi:two-component system aerobic respiration control sensor histidine kinase ArcB
MDDIIAKPVKKSRMITVLNELFGDQELLPTIEIAKKEPSSVNPLTKTMDLDFIVTLVDTIGHEMVIASLGVFKEKIPEYMETLHLSLTAKDKDDVCSQAHKIKGAASSIGLSRIQKIANQIQQGDHPTWWKNVHEWVDELDAAIAHDVDGFDDWIKTQNFAE